VPYLIYLLALSYDNIPSTLWPSPSPTNSEERSSSTASSCSPQTLGHYMIVLQTHLWIKFLIKYYAKMMHAALRITFQLFIISALDRGFTLRTLWPRRNSRRYPLYSMTAEKQTDTDYFEPHNAERQTNTVITRISLVHDVSSAFECGMTVNYAWRSRENVCSMHKRLKKLSFPTGLIITNRVPQSVYSRLI
jgi:hypothetical protein